MDTAPLLAQERSLKVDSQNLRARFDSLILPGNIFRDSLNGSDGVVHPGSDRCGQQRSSAKSGQPAGDGAQRGSVPFHHIAAAGPVDVHIDETGHGSVIRSVNLVRAGWQSHSRARSYHLNLAFTHQDSRVQNFSLWRDGFANVQKCGCHGHW